MSTPVTTVSPEHFAEWRSPRRGLTNPQILSNDVWAWLVNSRIDAYRANEHFDGPSSFDAGPCWCFDRFGQTQTRLPDGRLVFVGGEHEDYYDPDFYIYNDVVVVAETGEISIYGYPVDLFPPTDFHTATLLDNTLILIGNLSYGANRRSGQTQVLRLDLETWEISIVATEGDMPGWIHEHTAALATTGNEILVTGGKIDRCDGGELIENIDDWSLDIRTWYWTRLTRRPWTRFQLYREDKSQNHLWEMRQLLWSREVRWHDTEEQAKKLTEALDALPDLDLLTTLYAPDIATEIIGKDPEEYDTYRIRIDDVIVRYTEDRLAIQVTVEGIVSSNILDQLKRDVVQKLSVLENTPITCVMISPQ